MELLLWGGLLIICAVASLFYMMKDTGPDMVGEQQEMLWPEMQEKVSTVQPEGWLDSEEPIEQTEPEQEMPSGVVEQEP